MSDGMRARERAQNFGPEMLRAIDQSVGRIEEEIRAARAMKSGEVMALLLTILEPLRDIREQVHGSDADCQD